MSCAGFSLDLGRCVGCGACVLACRMENGWAADAPWRRVIPLNLERHPGGPTYHISAACHHCEEPACLRACPSAAYEQRPDGAVILVGDRCLGCRYCEMACPFGAPAFDEAVGVMMKCDFCHERVDRGLSPVCVAACPTGALGTLSDGEGSDQEVSDREGMEKRDPATIPGFSDPADCNPSLRFRDPGGSVRAGRLDRLREVLKR